MQSSTRQQEQQDQEHTDGTAAAAAVIVPKRVDMLTELESIAQVALAETGFFCSNTHRLQRIAAVKENRLVAARECGFLEQR